MKKSLIPIICCDDELELVAQVREFEQSINSTPMAVADRLWTKNEEKLRFSK